MAQDSGTSITIFDGGMSRELMRLKAPFQQPEWSAFALMHEPRFVKQVHQDFVAAGSNVLTTNSYALVPFHIGEERFRQQGKELAELAGQLTKEVAAEEKQKSGRQVLTAGSLPPIFGSYRPDLFNEEKVQDYLSVLVSGLLPYVDIWLGETLSLIAEAEAVLSAIQGTGKKCWIAFTLDDQTVNATEAATEPRLRSKELVVDAASWAASNRSVVSGLLFNCSQPEYMSAALLQAKTVFAETGCQMPLGVYANAFEPKPDDYKANEDVAPTRRDLDPELYAEFARRWAKDGATIIGGCCGIGHEHIQALSRSLSTNDSDQRAPS